MKRKGIFLSLPVFALLIASIAGCGGGGGTVSSPPPAPPPQPQPLAVSVTPSTSQLSVNANQQFGAKVSGGSGNATLAWSVNTVTGGNATFGTVSANGMYTAPALIPAGTITVTATATDSTGSASGSATVTVSRSLHLGFAPNSAVPNNEIYLEEEGALVIENWQVNGAVTGDLLNVQSTYGPLVSTPLTVPAGQSSIIVTEVLDFGGTALYIPGPITAEVKGIDGSVSNIFHMFFTGSLPTAVEDPVSGELYYNYTGDSTTNSFAILKFKNDGTPDGQLSLGGAGIAFDSSTGYLIVSANGGGVFIWDPMANNGAGTSVNTVLLTAPRVSTFAVDAKGGVLCGVQTAGNTVSCIKEVPASLQPQPPTIVASGLNRPAAIVMLDAAHFVVYSRGDQTLRWFDISSGTAVASGMLNLTGFTLFDANYQNSYPLTGGWYLAMTGSTIGVMGQTVNADGSVSQGLAFVSNGTQKLIGPQYVTLPAGAMRIAADAANAAFAVEYPDATGPAPVTRIARFDAQTGLRTDLSSTSTVVPATGFLATKGGKLAFFVQSKIDMQTNQ